LVRSFRLSDVGFLYTRPRPEVIACGDAPSGVPSNGSVLPYAALRRRRINPKPTSALPSSASDADPGMEAGKIPTASEGFDAADSRFRPSPILARRIDGFGGGTQTVIVLPSNVVMVNPSKSSPP
jgi:hypothetical protein